MLKKSIPILSVIAAVVLLLITTNALTNLNTEDGIQELKQIVINYIECANSVSAQAAYDKLLADFGDSDLVVPAVYQIGEKFREKAQYKSAILAHKFIVDNFPESEQAVWAQRGLAASYIGLGDMESAQIQAQKLIDEYISDPNIAQAVFEVADTYCWFGKNEKARPLYQMVIDNWPEAQHCLWAQMGIAISYIADGNDSAAWDAADKLIQTYPDEKNLAEALFYIGGRFEWARNYDNAISVFNYIVENFPASIWAENAVFDIDKSNIYRFVEGRDEPNALSAIVNFINTYSNKPELPAVVYDFGARADWINGFEPNQLTELIFRTVINTYPENILAKKSSMKLLKMDVLRSVLSDGDANEVIDGVNVLATDYNDIPETADDLMLIASRISGKGWQSRGIGDEQKARLKWHTAVDVRRKIIEHFPDSIQLAPAYYTTGVVLAQNLHEYERGIEYFEKVVEQWPEYRYAWHAQFFIGKYYEKLKLAGVIPKQDADIETEKAYKSVLENYPNSEAAKWAALGLGQINVNKESWSDAAGYLDIAIQESIEKNEYTRFSLILSILGDCYTKLGEPEIAAEIYISYLPLTDPNDSDTGIVRGKLRDLQGGVR